MTDFRIERDNLINISEPIRTGEKLQASHRFLQIANRHAEMIPLLDEFIAEIKTLSGCAAIGMRILDRKGNIPFVAYTGFSRRFYEKESPLSIRNGDTACIRVICNRIDPVLPFYTPGGSFFVNGTSRFPEATAAAGRKEPCSVCRSYGYESVALIPIRLGDQILGLIHVADPGDDRVPQEMVQILEDGAMQLGAAIKRVRAEEELRKSNEALEERVKIRTAELAAINRELVRQMAEREQVESALRKSENELRLLSGRLLSAEEKERKRIARELHDGIGQALSAIKFGVENALRSLQREPASTEVDSLKQIVPFTQKTIEEVRRIVKDLRPSILDDLGILATINWFCREFKSLYAPIGLDHTINAEEDDVPEHLKTVIYRILQEALNNVAKHSRAGRVSIGLEKKDALLVFGISDDGIGFDPEQVVSLERSERGVGLASMRERTELTGGHFFISSGRQTGTTIRIVWSLALGAQRVST